MRLDYGNGAAQLPATTGGTSPLRACDKHMNTSSDKPAIDRLRQRRNKLKAWHLLQNWPTSRDMLKAGCCRPEERTRNPHRRTKVLKKVGRDALTLCLGGDMFHPAGRRALAFHNATIRAQMGPTFQLCDSRCTGALQVPVGCGNTLHVPRISACAYHVPTFAMVCRALSLPQYLAIHRDGEVGRAKASNLRRCCIANGDACEHRLPTTTTRPNGRHCQLGRPDRNLDAEVKDMPSAPKGQHRTKRSSCGQASPGSQWSTMDNIKRKRDDGLSLPRSARNTTPSSNSKVSMLAIHLIIRRYRYAQEPAEPHGDKMSRAGGGGRIMIGNSASSPRRRCAPSLFDDRQLAPSRYHQARSC